MLLLGIGVTLAVIGPVFAGRSAGSPQSATSLFVSPSGTDGGFCSRSAPCATWDRAYQQAKPGQVIEVAGGTYPGQIIASRQATRNLSPGCTPATPSLCIVFRPAAGQAVVVNGPLQVNASSVWVQGSASPATHIPRRGRGYSIRVTGYVDTEATNANDFPDHVVLEGIAATSFGVFDVETALLRNMDIGPGTTGANCRVVEGPAFENRIGYAGPVAVVPRNVTLDGLIIHNQTRNADGAVSDCHIGGLFLQTANGLTIENSVFSQNAVYNIQVQNFSDAPPATNVTIQNTLFGCPVDWVYESGGDTRCNGQADIQFNAASLFSNWLIRYNSFSSGLGQYVKGASYSNIRVMGNAGSRPSLCFPGMTFGYNAWVDRGCAPTDRVLQGLPFVSLAPGLEDFHLVAASPARALVQPLSADLQLGSDIAGQTRPVRFPRDAGALERDTALLLPGRSIGAAAIGMSSNALRVFYGQPRASRSTKIGSKHVLARIDTFAVPGGSLRATMVGDDVVGLSTSSAFYSTPKGVGPGSPFADATRTAHATWVPCTHAAQSATGAVVVSYAPTAGRRRIAAVSMIRRLYVQPCGHTRS